jgi:hypothetical protein
VPARLQEQTTLNFSVGKSFAENLTGSLTALNLADRRSLLDNGQTFDGTHDADPRQITSACAIASVTDSVIFVSSTFRRSAT